MAVETQNTNPEDVFSSWDLDISCSGTNQHSEITSSSGGIQVDWVPTGNPAATPSPDSVANVWTAPGFNNSTGAFSSSYCAGGVTAATWANAIYNPVSGARLPFISNTCDGDYSTSNTSGALFWRQCVTIPTPAPTIGPPNFTITKALASAVTNIGANTLILDYTIVLCNTGGPVTNGGTTVTDNFPTNVSSCSQFQFGCWGYGDSIQPYQLCYNDSSGNANEPSVNGSSLVFPDLGTGCVTMTAQVEDYYDPVASCGLTLVDQASVAWPGGTKTTGTLTYIQLMPTPTFTWTYTKTQTPTSTWTQTPTQTPTRTWTWTPTITPTPTWTKTNTPNVTNTFTWTQTPTPTPTKTPTPTYTYTVTPTFTPTITRTVTNTFTQTLTPTPTYTPTKTNTVTSTVTSTYTNTVVNTPTFTSTYTRTNTPTVTWTVTPTVSPTYTNTKTNTVTPTNTFTITLTYTPTITPTITNTRTPTYSPTFTPTNTFTVLNTPTSTYTPTVSPTFTFTKTNTVTPTNTFTITMTYTPTVTPTITVTKTPTISPTFTQTFQFTPTISNTFTVTFTPTVTVTITPTVSPTFTFTKTNTVTPTNTPTQTQTNTFTVLNTPTSTYTPTVTPTVTVTKTPTVSPTFTQTFQFTPTISDTFTPTNTPTFTNTKTNTVTPTNTLTVTLTQTPTVTLTVTATMTPTVSPTFTQTFQFTPTITDTFTTTSTYTVTSTWTPSFTPTVTFTQTDTRTMTPTWTDTPIVTATWTPTPSNTPTWTNSFTATKTPTNTYTPQFTYTQTFTPTQSYTPTSTFTPTNTFTPSATRTPSPSPTSTFSPTPTWTWTSTYTPTPTPTATPSPTPTPATFLSLSKQASSSTAESGSSLTYTLNLSVTGSSVQNVVLTDILPPQETFASFGSSPAGTATAYDSTQSLLTWTLPSPLAPGNYQMTYQAGVNNFIPSGTTLVNNAQAVYAGQSAPLTASATVNVTGSYTVKIGVYNEAGELIYELPVQHYSQSLDNYSLTPGNTITSLHGADNAVSLVYAGVVIGTWNGTNQGGNLVSNGNYYVKVDNIDNFGVVRSTTQPIIVNRSLYKADLTIYNEAGEAVRHLLTYVDDPGPTGVNNIQLSTSVFDPSPNGSSGSNRQLQISFGAGTTVVWDGTDDTGAFVSTGQYFIAVHSQDGQGGDTNVTLKVTVIGTDAKDGTGFVSARPNILNRTSPTGYVTTFHNDSTMPLTLRLRVYDMAGELVQPARLGVMGTNNVQWDASQASSGIYLAVVESLNAQGGVISRTTFKVAVIH